MFEVGERVACVIDGWPVNWLPAHVIFPLKKGGVYVVAQFYPAGTRLPCGGKILRPSLAIGMDNEAIRLDAHAARCEFSTYDLWPADWFRRLQRNDESVTRAMSIFHKMTETTKTPEVIGA